MQVGPFGSLSAQCQEAVLWRVAEAVLMPPGSAGSSTPLHLCALNESCLWEWLAQWCAAAPPRPALERTAPRMDMEPRMDMDMEPRLTRPHLPDVRAGT